MANPKGVTQAGTPAGKDATADAADKREKDKATAPSTAANSSNATDARASSAQPARKEGDPPSEQPAKEPSPVDKLRAGMVATEAAEPTPEPEEKTEATGDEPADEVETKDEDAGERQPEAEVEERAGDEPEEHEPAKAEGEDAPDESPFKGFTPDERNALGKKAQARIKELNSAKKELARKFQENQPFVEAGQFVEKFRVDHGMSEDEVVDALELAARYKAGDPKVVDALEANLAQIRSDLGMPAPVQEEAAIEPYKGALAQHYQDMVDVLGLPEDQVRLYAALDARVKAKKDAPPPAPKQPAPAPRQPAARPQQQPTAGFDAAMVRAAGENVLSFLETEGVPRAQARDHMNKNLWPLLVKHAPVNPRTNQRDPRLTPPDERLRAVKIAQQAFVLEQARKRSAERAKQPAPLQKSGGAPPANPRGGNNGAAKPEGPNPLQQLRKSMVRSA